MLRNEKKRYVTRLKSLDAKHFWSAVKNLNGASSSTIPTLKHNGEEAKSNLEKAAMLNNYFSSCFNTPLPSSGHTLPLSPDDLHKTCYVNVNTTCFQNFENSS